MVYLNSETGLKLDLGNLDAIDRDFYRLALRLFKENARWTSFNELILGMQSPLYRRDRPRRDFRSDPLYLALKDMSIQLGIRQGMIAPRAKARVG